MIEGKPKKTPKTKAVSQDGKEPQETPTFRQNPEIDARIDRFIADNPKDAAYYQGLPPERLFRTIMKFMADREDTRLRMQQSLIRKLDRHPEVKEATMKAVESMPENQKQKVLLSVARGLTSAATQGPRPAV